MWLGLGLTAGLALRGSVTLAGRTRGNLGHGSWDTATLGKTAALGSRLPRLALFHAAPWQGRWAVSTPGRIPSTRRSCWRWWRMAPLIVLSWWLSAFLLVEF